MKLIGLLGCLTGSKTKTALNFVLDNIKKNNPGIEVEFIDLKDYDIEFCDGRSNELYNDDTKDIVNKIMAADRILIGTPIYQGGIPGVLKNLIDLIPYAGLKGKTTGIVATGGTSRHFLVPEYQLKPVLSSLESDLIDRYVFLDNNDFENGIIRTEDVINRLEQLSKDIIK